jgi:hypothetical protein
MNDLEMNPMKTGLMFVPLGLAGDWHFCNVSRGRGHLAELEAEIAAVGDLGAKAGTPQLPMFRRLLDYFRRASLQSQHPSPTSV